MKKVNKEILRKELENTIQSLSYAKYKKVLEIFDMLK